MIANIASYAIHVTLHTGALPKLQTLVQEDTVVAAQVLPFQRDGGAAVGYSAPQAYLPGQPSHSSYNKGIGSTSGSKFE